MLGAGVKVSVLVPLGWLGDSSSRSVGLSAGCDLQPGVLVAFLYP